MKWLLALLLCSTAAAVPLSEVPPFEARKLAMIIWHMLTKDTDYIWMRPALLARKFRSIELRAGLPTSHATRGSAYDYNIPAKRAEERVRVECAEQEYAKFASRWRTKPRSRKSTVPAT